MTCTLMLLLVWSHVVREMSVESCGYIEIKTDTHLELMDFIVVSNLGLCVHMSEVQINMLTPHITLGEGATLLDFE